MGNPLVVKHKPQDLFHFYFAITVAHQILRKNPVFLFSNVFSLLTNLNPFVLVIDQ